jgi:hypothetical protein
MSGVPTLVCGRRCEYNIVQWNLHVSWQRPVDMVRLWHQPGCSWFDVPGRIMGRYA